MRAREFTINVPINIRINGDGDPEIDVAGNNDSEEPDENPIYVSPLQQELELKKAAVGKDSAVIDKITEPEDIGKDDDSDDTPDDLSRLKQIIKGIL
jgi:hypothetical protein